MKKTEIASQVFGAVDALPLTPIAADSLRARVTDVPALALVPWFCEASVQWALRLTDPAKPLARSALAKVNGSFVSVHEGRLLLGVPGDGLEPSTLTLTQVAEAVAQAMATGTTLELAAANLGMVKRDWEVKAESLTTNGNQRYLGTLAADGVWNIERSTPALSHAELQTALDCGRKFVALGPWEVRDKAEAESVLMLWLSSPQANINPMAVRQLMSLRGLRFEKAGTAEQHRRMGDIDRRLYGLALGFFRHRLAGGPFRWNESGDVGHSAASLEEVVRAVVSPDG